MEYKVIFMISVLFYFSQEVNTLKCYKCVSQLPNETCFSPINTEIVPAVQCNKSAVDVVNMFGISVNPQVLQAAENANEFECILYEKQSASRNVTQMGRSCVPKIPELNACVLLNLTSGIESSNLTRCETCTTDYCNSTSTLQISALILIFVCTLNNTFK